MSSVVVPYGFSSLKSKSVDQCLGRELPGGTSPSSSSPFSTVCVAVFLWDMSRTTAIDWNLQNIKSLPLGHQQHSCVHQHQSIRNWQMFSTSSTADCCRVCCPGKNKFKLKYDSWPTWQTAVGWMWHLTRQCTSCIYHRSHRNVFDIPAGKLAPTTTLALSTVRNSYQSTMQAATHRLYVKGTSLECLPI